MKLQNTLCVLFAGAALLSIQGRAQDSVQQDTLEQRVEQLEKELVEVTASLEALTEAAEAEAAELDGISRYLQQQAAAAKTMVGTLATSESQGFTAGINYESRHTLLGGWRNQLAAAQKGVPGTAAEPEAEAGRARIGQR